VPVLQRQKQQRWEIALLCAAAGSGLLRVARRASTTTRTVPCRPWLRTVFLEHRLTARWTSDEWSGPLLGQVDCTFASQGAAVVAGRTLLFSLVTALFAPGSSVRESGLGTELDADQNSRLAVQSFTTRFNLGTSQPR
jgi:hypothetical protein